MEEMETFEFTPNNESIKELYTWYSDNISKIDKNQLITDK